MTDTQFQPGQGNPLGDQSTSTAPKGNFFGGNEQDPSLLLPEDQKKTFVAETTISEPVEQDPFGGNIQIPEPSFDVSQKESSLYNQETIPINDKKHDDLNTGYNFDLSHLEPKENKSSEPNEHQIETISPTEGNKAPEHQSDKKDEQITSPEFTPNNQSEFQKKYNNLLQNIEKLNTLLHIGDGEVFDIIGANNERMSVLYQFGLNEQKEIYVKRIETEKKSNETNFNDLKLTLNSESHLFEIFLDDILLFEESTLLKDNKKSAQVVEKINKLIFLTESKLKDVEKEQKAKQEEEEERKRLQDIFRNF